MTTQLEPNSILSHYRIISKLGAGGMGEVYLAQDTKLERKVALKILLPDIASNQERMERFIREAKSAASLSHPNIAQIFEIGEAEGTHYIAMEYVDGVTLREKIHRERNELSKLLRIMQHTADGLAKAHAAGIVHRDLKPDNIMITHDGHAKILDFGLAKLTEGRGDEATRRLGDEEPTVAFAPRSPVAPTLSMPGMIMGTVGYMSPEQAEGKTNEIDHRSDIFSFGCILFEVATGQKPFTGDTVVKSLHSLLYEPAPQVKELNPEAPVDLQRIVRRCLAKDRESRFQTIKEVAIELKELREELKASGVDTTVVPTSTGRTQQSTRVGNVTSTQSGSLSTGVSSAEYLVSGMKRHKFATTISMVVIAALLIGAGVVYWRGRAAESSIRSIAVMPFVNEGGNAEAEYLSDGMTESLIASLSQVPNLTVKARSSVLRYKGKETDPKTVGSELNVQAILNGRVSHLGDKLILILELVDVKTENVLWSEQYNRSQADLVALQSEIARDVSTKLKMRLTGVDEQQVAKTYTQNPEAYKLFLQGRFFANKRTQKDSQKAIECFQQAVNADPNYALAYSGLGIAYAYLAIYGNVPAKEVFPRARQYAEKAMELDKTLADPHILLGLLNFLQRRDIAAWERELQIALELNPNSTDAHRLNGLRLLFVGKFDEAIASVQKALDSEPLSLAGNINYAYGLFYAGRVAEAENQTLKTIDLSPDFWMSHYYLANTYRLQGKHALAAEEMAKAKELRDEAEAAKLIRETFAKGGWSALLRAVVARPADFKMSSYDMATFCVEAGDKEKAFEMLNKSVDDYEQFAGFMKIDPFLRPLQSDPRFVELLKKIGLPA
jgi:serine/threonine-protein kinase